MKLPAIVQQPVGEFALGNIQKPNALQLGKAYGDLVGAAGELTAAIIDANTVNEIDAATGDAAEEISQLRAKLVNQNTIPIEEMPDGTEPATRSVLGENGEREEVELPIVFTHEVAEQMWDKGTEEIISAHAAKIGNNKARAKFLEEMQTRYVVPGTLAVVQANVARGRSYGQANAERSMEDILSSNAPTEVREEQSREIIARQLLLGADPVWAENQLRDLGPRIDQLDTHNAIIAAGTVDEVDMIEETMYTDGNRMLPAQMRTMSANMDARRREFKAEEAQAQDEYADEVFLDYHNPDVPIGPMDIAADVAEGKMTREAGWTFINGMKTGAGAAPKASNQFVLSHYRSEIQKLQFVGNNMRIDDKAALLSLIVTRGSMGLNPNGTPTGQPPSISGVDALTLTKEIAAAQKAATENQPYKDALGSLLLWTRSKLDLQGQITTTLGGNQNQVEAAVAFKGALDNYMQSYGIDAKPQEFFDKNKDAYDPRHFSRGIDARFLEKVPQADAFMEREGEEISFTTTQQENFALWLSTAGPTIGPAKLNEYVQLFNQFYRGQGVPPQNGKLMLEPDDPLYRQFQQAIPNVE